MSILEFIPEVKKPLLDPCKCVEAELIFLRTNILHVMVFEVVYGTCVGEILILRHRNLSKQRLLRFLRLSINILTVWAVKRFRDYNTKFYHVGPVVQNKRRR